MKQSYTSRRTYSQPRRNYTSYYTSRRRREQDDKHDKKYILRLFTPSQVIISVLLFVVVFVMYLVPFSKGITTDLSHRLSQTITMEEVSAGIDGLINQAEASLDYLDIFKGW